MDSTIENPITKSREPGWAERVFRSVLYLICAGAFIFLAIIIGLTVVFAQFTPDFGRAMSLGIVFGIFGGVIVAVFIVTIAILYQIQKRADDRVDAAQKRTDEQIAAVQAAASQLIAAFAPYRVGIPSNGTVPQLPESKPAPIATEESKPEWTQINNHTYATYAEKEIEHFALRACKLLPPMGLNPSQGNIQKYAGATSGGLASAVQMTMKEWGWVEQDGAGKEYRWSEKVVEQHPALLDSPALSQSPPTPKNKLPVGG